MFPSPVDRPVDVRPSLPPSLPSSRRLSGAPPTGWWPVLTWRLGLFAAIFSIAAAVLPVGAPVGLLVVDGGLAVLALIDCGLTVDPRRIAVKRILPATVPIGEEASIEWEVSNPARSKVRVAVADELAPSLQAGTRRIGLVLRGGDTAVASTGFRPFRRGDFRPVEMVVRTTGPIGLMGRQATRWLPGHLRVLPSFRSKREAELRMDRARVLEVGLRSARFRGSGTEFEQLRDYTPDDEFRRIDWAATARSHRPIVRTFRAERNQVVIVLLDNGRVMAGRVDGVPRVEHAMDAVMTIAAVSSRMGDRMGLVAFDRQVRGVVAPSNSPGQFRRVVDTMYPLEPVLAESDYRRAFLETLVRFRRRSLLMILTELADQAMQEELLSSLPLILRRHLVVVGTVRDPQVEAWASESPTDAGSAYRQAAAISALAERRRLISRLTKMGVAVVDAPPGRFAGLLTDYYLDVKAAGRL